MNTILKRVISLMLCFVLVAGYLPVGALAEEMDTVQEPSADTTVVVEEEAAAEAEENEDTSLTEDDENTSTVGDAEKEVSEEPSADEEAETPSEGDEVVTEEDVTENETVTEEPAAEEAEETASIVEEVSLVAPLLDAGNVIDAAIFCSDVHGNPSTVTSVFNGIKSADSTFNPSTASFVGDTQCTASSVTSAAQSVYSGLACYYAFGNHDDEGDYGISDVTGLLYGSDTTNYYIYAISENDMSTSSPDTSGFTSTVDGLDKSKPLFIISHMPLHSRRGDNNGAAAWYEAISAAAEKMDIAFFWAHNHTGDNATDQAAYYVAKDGSETITVEGGSTVKPNFTYANAGYIDPPNSAARVNVATAVRIYDDSINYTVYNASGELSGTYAVNETVTREFANSTDSGDSGDGSTDEGGDTDEGGTTTETKEVYVLVDTMTVGEDYLIANGNTGTVTLLGQSSGSATTTTAAVTTSGDYTYIETADSGYIWNATESTNSSASGPRLINNGYAIYYSNGLTVGEVGTATNGAVYTRYWTYTDGQLACVSTNNSTTYYLTYSDGYSMTSTATDGIYIYEKQTITVSSDGTTSGGDSGNTGDGEDDTTTGGSTETVVGNGTYTTADDGSYQKVTFGTEGEKKTLYVLVDSITSGEEYLIVNTNSTGTGYGLGNTTSGDHAVTITSGNLTVNGTSGTYTYIEDKGDALEWTATGSDSSVTFASGEYDLGTSGSGNSRALTVTSSSSWVFTGSALYYDGQKDYYVAYSSGSWGISSSNTSSRNVYLYQKVEIDTSSTVTYSVTASDIEHFYTADTTDTETVTITASVTEGTPDGTYAYEVVGGDEIITSIAENGVITFNGAEGTAQVKVSYTWTDGENTYTIWQVIDVTATSPYYTLDLHKANAVVNEATNLTAWAEGTTYYTYDETTGTYTQVDTTVTTTPDSDVTYYYVTYELGDEITAPIAIKGIEEGDQYGVWAVVKYYDGTTETGTDMGAVGSDVEWSSSDKSIATVDPVTGIITFTGKEGTVNITATYKNGNKPSDTITISVTQSQYSVPADGTNDFPEYPNEGAIRYDKTATAVGNFSETGIAQIELSMTGVPYTTGSELDVVLMLDITGSMHDVTSSSYTYSQYTRVEATIIAAMEFVESIVVNEDGSYNNNRVGIYSFNSEGTYTLWELAKVTNLDTVNAAIQKFNDNFKSGGTPYDDGLSKVQSVLTAAKKDGTGNNRQQFAIFMTDGVPTDYEYVTGSSHANYSSASDIAGMLTSSDNYQTRDTDYYYEYYSTEMKADDVTVYTVGIGLENTNSAWSGTATQCLNLASRLLNDISGPAGETTQPDAVGTSTLSKQDEYFFSVEDSSAATDMANVFTNIAMKILQAATDVTVEDQITDEYTMIFDIPTGSKSITGVTNDFYIEFLKYTLDSNHERVDSDNDGDTYDDATSITKLYLGTNNGTYYAASDASGTAYAAPTFAQTTIGDKGTLYYWTTDSGYATKAAVQYSDGTNTYYFIPYGMEANEDGSAPTNWYNMTSGAYAYGTINSDTNMSENLVIATPYFVYNAKTKMLYWTVDKLDTEEYALRYFLYLNNSATEVGTGNEVDAATYPTNDHAYITYTNFRGNGCQQKFPIPQLTWNGAQVSYVFYLVNAAGQPINKSGQVVDFANAVFITDVYTKAVVWNKGVDGTTGTGELSADWLADELLPDEYTIYDELAGFTLNVYEKADGTTIKNQFTIEGDTAANISSSLNTRLNLETTASTVSTVTTKVYNTKAGQKVTGYGTYYSTDTNMAGIDFSNVTVAFAVVWESKLVEDVVVVDYGLDVLINVVQNDLMQNTVSGIGVGNTAYGNTAMNTGVIATAQLGTAALTIDGNTISIENENAVRFHQDDMEFTEPVKFYYESPVKFYEDSEQKTGYMYSSVTVIPATTIYYEEDFLTLTSFTKGTDGTFVEDETSAWTTEGTKTNKTQDQDRPGESKISEALDADNNYGYDSAYETMATHSLNSSAMITVDANTRGEATFTFYGTGFDVISTTSNATGTITVKVTETGDADKDGTANEAVKNTVVDTYYGYTQNDDGEWVTSVNDPNALYQVPVIKIAGLPYGQYSVKITAGYNEYFDNVEGSTSYDLYLDAIRIYDPTGNEDETANNAYVADGEGWPQYFEVRNQIIPKDTFDSLNDEAVSGIVFIDGIGNGPDVAEYTSYGPNNETYLANGQAIAFDLNGTYTVPAGKKLAKIQLAVKTVGETGAIEVYGVKNGAATACLNETISTATDMYYDITALDGQTVVIKSTGEAIISITNVKVTYAPDETAVATASVEDQTETPALFSVRRSSVEDALETLDVEEEVPETTEPTETEPSVPETTEPEETEPEETEPETTEPEVTEPEEDTSDNVTADKVVETVKKFVKKLFGWIFG